jgi:hypothetical protein
MASFLTSQYVSDALSDSGRDADAEVPQVVVTQFGSDSLRHRPYRFVGLLRVAAGVQPCPITAVRAISQAIAEVLMGSEFVPLLIPRYVREWLCERE